jgi:subtilase family serine protease
LGVKGSANAVEKLFHVQLNVYQHPSQPRTFYAPVSQPMLDKAIPITWVGGLDNFSPPRPQGFGTFLPHLAPPAIAADGSGIGGTYLGSDFRQAYVPGVTLTGEGQAVALVEFDSYYTNDIIAYANQAGLTNVPLQNVLLDGSSGSPGPNNGEVALDIEMALAMAPGVSNVIVYQTAASGFGDDILNRIATDNSAKQISSSWNFGVDPNTEQIFLQFAAQGQSYFNASGDGDAYVSGVPNPDDDPNITIVGGTTLTTAPDGSWSEESAWNRGGGLGTGGGISAAYPIPRWQQGINMATNLGSVTHRNIPDVAMVADNVEVIYDNGTVSGFYGTSCAAPLWAGFMALVNQQAAANGTPSAGFVNPAIYRIGSSTNCNAMFHDITNGNNTSANSPTQFYAVPAYDLCTGWGTPNGSNLINALATPESLYISPAHDFTSTGPLGGPFTPASQTYAITNFGTATLSWQLSAGSNWLSLSATSGILNPGASTAVTGTLNSLAATLPAGTYTNIEYFTNQTDGVVQAIRFILQVWGSLIANGGFETASFTGWTNFGNTSSTYVITGSTYAYSGEYGAKLGPAVSLGYLAQTVGTAPGQPYWLSLWLDSPDGKAPNEFAVNWNGTSLFDQVNLKKFGWTNLQFLVTGCVSNSLLQLAFRDDASFLGLDSVSLVAVPVPLLQHVFTVGNRIVFTWNTLAGIKYQAQYQTNLLQTNWLDLGDTLIATNSTITVSDTAAAGGQKFYRLLLSP